MTLQLHPLCTLFPRLDGGEFAALRDDIATNGLQHAIVLHSGMILDGGNRYRACIEAGIDPIFEDFPGGNLVAFVLSRNLHRRHMTPGQQAAIVASAQDWGRAQTIGSNQHAPKAGGPATLPDHDDADYSDLKSEKSESPAPPLSTVAQRAAQSGASERTQRMADKVARENPELARRVGQGDVSLPKAVEQLSQNAKAAPKATPPKPSPDPLIERIGELEELTAAYEGRNAELEQENKMLLLAADAEVLARIRGLQGHIDTITQSRDNLLNENAELKREIKRLRREVDKAKGAN